jgi:hypothetical protein
MPANIRISPRTHRALSQIAAERSSSLQEALDSAVENERRHLLLERTNAAYAALRRDVPSWQEWVTELREFDTALGDGLE